MLMDFRDQSESYSAPAVTSRPKSQARTGWTFRVVSGNRSKCTASSSSKTVAGWCFKTASTVVLTFIGPGTSTGTDLARWMASFGWGWRSYIRLRTPLPTSWPW
uniref:(northern house mosquito) hypothetical protein n=1 Tax=Culex pipiens TaxID=7175 RepID=A0A8D8DJ24_CULPI